jgi:hypothetical protein
MNRTFACCLALIVLISAFPALATAQMLNPYAPMNAVAAEPLDPYNLWEIPPCSRTSYFPCPSPIPYSMQLPDYPPVRAPFPGPWGLPIPVPVP